MEASACSIFQLQVPLRGCVLFSISVSVREWLCVAGSDCRFMLCVAYCRFQFVNYRSPAWKAPGTGCLLVPAGSTCVIAVSHLPFVKVGTFIYVWIYLIGGLIVLITDLFLEQGRRIACMFFKEPVEVGIVLKIELTGYFFYRMFAPE